MNKQFFAAGTIAPDCASSAAAATAEALEPFFRRCFKNLHISGLSNWRQIPQPLSIHS